MKNRAGAYSLYLGLIILFSVAVAYLAPVSWSTLKSLFPRSDRVRPPFSVEALNPVVSAIAAEAKDAGLRKGDRILSVNDRQFAGYGVMMDAFANAHPGDWLTVTTQRQEGGRSQQQILKIRLAPAPGPSRSLGETVTIVEWSIVTPWFCLLLGFWVAAVRPRDGLAWLLLGLMISFSQIANEMELPLLQGWERDVAVGYHKFFASAWPIWMLLFGVYFPERSDFEKRRPWLKWILIGPLLFFAVTDTVVTVGSIESFSSVQRLYRLVHPLNTFAFVLGMVAVGTFFANLHSKQATTANCDARRRLTLLVVGTQVSLTPMFILILYGLWRHAGPLDNVPSWLAVLALLMCSLFPITLAYVIVVERALDVRVVIRQGVRYALAKGGVRLLRVAASVAIIAAIISLISRPKTSWSLDIIVIAAGWAILIYVRKIGERLVNWIDRRFFREAYNAEQILSDLSEKVRTIVETRPLLEIVAQRISESLHVLRVALLLDNGGIYHPAHAVGYAGLPDVRFNDGDVIVKHLQKVKQPLRVNLKDSDLWLNEPGEMDQEESARLKELAAQLLLPLAAKEKLLGFITLGPKQSEEPYSGSDLRLLQSVATQTGLALENSRLTAAIAAEVAQRERLNRELEIAREVQERLFPQDLPPVPGLDYCGACRPAFGVGGDYYDFVSLASGELGIAIGDVSGKGISAALLMASLQASLRGQTIDGGCELSKLMGNVNRLVYDASASNRYATFFYSQYQPGNRSLTYVNAGHNAPMVLRKNEGTWDIIRLETGGPVVGLLPGAAYEHATLILHPGDMLLAFTDGISEAMNPAEEEWGEKRLIEAAKDCLTLNAAGIIDKLMKAADAFAAGAVQHDDMTLVVARVVAFDSTASAAAVGVA
ncbi:MAG TPA: SpoIIE family protein phosphatase [Acidobacteriota bacterium]|jgi:sigma-B regulation protein RsbU (phosphoserine phosphatase)